MSESVENGVTVYRGRAVPHIYEAMIRVKERISKIGLSKNRTAPREMGGYAFRGIDDLYDTLCQIEAEEGVMAYPSVLDKQIDFRTNDKGKTQTHIIATIGFKFVSMKDGSSETASALGEGIDSGDKASGKCQSGAVKSAHLSVYKIPTQGLNIDSESSTEEKVQSTPASFEKKLDASVGWAEWEKANQAALLACPAMGDLTECWSKVAAEGRGAPPGVLKRLAETKDKLKDSLRKLQAQPQ